MSPKKTTLAKLIDNGNHQKLQAYLAKHPEDISNQDFDLASKKFLASDNKNISNRYSVLKLLTHRVSAEAVVRLEQQTTYQTKYSEYTEHQTNRNLLKSLDNIIEKDLIYPIKYPEKTSFIRKLLKLNPKRKALDIHNDLAAKLPDMIKSLKSNILKDERFKNASGELIISPEQLSLLIYERISLKTGKQLHMDRLTTDNLFSTLNVMTIHDINDQITKFKDTENLDEEAARLYLEQTKDEFRSCIPPHLVNFAPLLKTLEEWPPEKILHTAIKETIDTSVNNNIAASVKQLSAQEAKGLRGDSIETLKHLSSISQMLNRDNPYAAYAARLEAVQKQFFDDISVRQHKSKNLHKHSLSEFERQGILLLVKAKEIRKLSNNQILNDTEKKFFSKFVEYTTDNKKLNSRYSRLLKKSFFPKQYMDSISAINKYSYKTSHMADISRSIDKLSVMMTKKDAPSTITKGEKISFYDMGYVSNFHSKDDVQNMLELVDKDFASEKLCGYKTLSQNSAKIWKEFQDVVSQDISINSGDILMDVGKAYHELHHQRDLLTKLQDWVTSYSHAAVGLDNNTVHQMQAEYWEPTPIDPVNYLVTERFRIKPDKLVTDTMKSTLSKALNIDQKDLAVTLQAMYVEAAKAVNNDLDSKGLSGLNKVENSSLRRFKAGIADFIPFGHRGKEEVKSWAQKISSERNTGKNLGTILADETNDIICSEFTAKLTILTLAELDKQLTEKIQEKDPTFKPPAEGVVRLPFQAKEDLTKISPERLVRELLKVSAIEKIEQKGLAQALWSR
jgi:hypothetical protein